MNQPITHFTAIDFETAQGKPNSICQVGLVRVENGIITHELNLLVKPPNNFYWSLFSRIHGITPEATQNEPVFKEVWNQIKPFIENQNVVAHNGFSFDFRVLNQTLNHYGLAEPEYQKFCTYQIYKASLATLCEDFNIPLNHHDALSDAKACGELFKLYLIRK